jgi:putative NADH-flavin reductase
LPFEGSAEIRVPASEEEEAAIVRITLFGATGRTGRRVVEYALAEGHDVTAYVRDPARLATSDARLHVAVGDVLDAGSVAEAVEGSDAVISTLGGAGLADPGHTLSGGMRNVVAGMRAGGVSRVLAVAGSGVLDTPEGGLRGEAPGFPAIFRPINAEHMGTWRALRESGLRWTLVCCPDLVDGERTGRFRREPDRLPAGGSRISVEDTAGFLLEQLSSTEFLERRVGIAY